MGNQSPRLSFWVPRNTKQALISIIFRLWRFVAERFCTWEDYDLDIWGNLKYQGDGIRSGQKLEHWKPLSSFLTPRFATGTIDNEPCCKTDDGPLNHLSNEQRSELLLEQEPQDKPLVLKLLLVPHKAEAKSKQQKADLSRILSRVLPSFKCPFLDFELTTSQ